MYVFNTINLNPTLKIARKECKKENREEEEERRKKHKKLNATLRKCFLKTALAVICFKVAINPMDYSYENYF